MQQLFHILMFIIGAIFGSFLCCQARRLHFRDSHKKANLARRSICLHCKKQLAWYDNIPIISWLILRGKCRQCHHKIGIAELLSEILLAISFLAISFTININNADWVEWSILIVVLLFTIIVYFLAIYDGLYGELPSMLLYIIQIIAIIIAVLRQLTDQTSFQPILMSFAGGGILGGIYLILFLVSKGKWVGDGDWLLALAIGLALGSPWLAVIALFVANVSATFIMYPIIKKSKNHQLHFGPFLVFAFIICYVFADFLNSML